jgi:hypothetical protein
MRKKTTPEEDRLATCARLYAEHPDNEVAWRKLCEAALAYAGKPPQVVAAGTFSDIEEIFRAATSVAVAEKLAREEREREARRAAKRAGKVSTVVACPSCGTHYFIGLGHQCQPGFKKCEHCGKPMSRSTVHVCSRVDDYPF